jgi:predicted aspartyl protease
MMIDTGAALTLVTRKWAETHGLKINPTKQVSVRGAGGVEVKVVGTVSMVL